MSQPLSTATLRSLLSLTEKREKLLGELSAIEEKISAALGGANSGAAKPSLHRRVKVTSTLSVRPVKRSGKRGKRGAVKELILAALREAGEAGIAVNHLAAKLAIKPQNIHVWLHTTGKKSGLVKALGKGVYRLEKSLGVKTPKIKAPKPIVRRQKTRRKTGKIGRSLSNKLVI